MACRWILDPTLTTDAMRSLSRPIARPLLLFALALGGCSDSTERGNPVALGGVNRGLSREDSVRQGSVGSRESVAPKAAVSTAETVELDRLKPSDFQGFDQPKTIVGTVSGPVQTVTVTGSGAIKCTGTYGTLVGYDAGGVALGSTALSLIDPADCSTPDNPDDVTYGAQATLTVTTGIIATFEITPMSPLEFPVFDLIGHASATYTIELEAGSGGGGGAATLKVDCAPANPVRATTVTCTATTSDGSEWTVTHLKSTASNGQAIVDADVTGNPATSIDWSGAAIVSTLVEVTGLVAGEETVATDSYTVDSRVGRVPGWMDEDFPDDGFPAIPPSPVYAKTSPPFTTPYPGFTFSSTELAAEGALAMTIFMYPRPALGRFHTGPNAEVLFVPNPSWESDGRVPGFAEGIYLEASTKRSDPFYKKQKGPSPEFCRQSDMAQLHDALLAHEERHWHFARARLSPINLVRTLDEVVVLPGESLDGANQTLMDVLRAWGDSITSANIATHATGDNYPNCRVTP